MAKNSPIINDDNLYCVKIHYVNGNTSVYSNLPMEYANGVILSIESGKIFTTFANNQGTIVNPAHVVNVSITWTPKPEDK